MNIKTVLPKEAQERINSLNQLLFDIENSYVIRIRDASTIYEADMIRSQYQNDIQIKKLQEEICRIHITSPYTFLVSNT